MSSLIVDGSIRITLLHENVQVVSIPSDCVAISSWWILREYLVNLKLKTYFTSIILDSDGLSLVCSTSSIRSELLGIEGVKASPQKWKALVINVVGAATEIPGLVYSLAEALSKEKMSILHISTFEAEVFLVQERDVQKACNILATFADQQLHVNSADRSQRRDLSTMLASLTLAAHSEPVAEFKEGFTLQVLPQHLVLTRLNPEFPLENCTDILMKFLLFDSRYSATERAAVKPISHIAPSMASSFQSSSPKPSLGWIEQAAPSVEGKDMGRGMDSGSGFMWGFWKCNEEVTFLLEEGDAELFPEGALEISPQRWRVIKLSGRAIEFDETGVVSAMSRVETGIPSLNISTATTNCTLVPDELLDSTLDKLAEVLNCPVQY